MIVRLDTADVNVSAAFGDRQCQTLRCSYLCGAPNDLALFIAKYCVAPLQRALRCQQFEFAVQGIELVTTLGYAAGMSG